MPIYDFNCEKCSKVYERFTNFATQELPCRECQHPTYKVNRVYATDFVTKGDGFYMNGSAALATDKKKGNQKDDYEGFRKDYGI